ncbi:MAG: hypothetical protein K2Y42_00350 [Hyphomicrobium sp.]|nr:hypothetical protein [Hyphomicrobium sp.]
MKYDVYGGFELARRNNRLGSYEKTFWTQVDEAKDGLSRACGCYVFAMKNGSNLKPWYVGKAERQPFYKECFSPAKRLIFNEVLIERNGTPLLFFLPRVTPKRKLCKPTVWKLADIEFLETMLIGIALEQNADLANIQKTKMLREMCVPGVINSPQAAPTLPVRDLRNALGLSV